MKQVTFIIKNGEVEASGFKGGACDAATKAFEDVLGGTPKVKKRKSEFYEKEPTVTLKARGAR